MQSIAANRAAVIDASSSPFDTRSNSNSGSDTSFEFDSPVDQSTPSPPSSSSRRNHASSSSISLTAGRTTNNMDRGHGLGIGRPSTMQQNAQSPIHTSRHRANSSMAFRAGSSSFPRSSSATRSTSSSRHKKSSSLYNNSPYSRTLSGFLSRTFRKTSLISVTLKLLFLASVFLFTTALLGHGHTASQAIAQSSAGPNQAAEPTVPGTALLAERYKDGQKLSPNQIRAALIEEQRKIAEMALKEEAELVVPVIRKAVAPKQELQELTMEKDDEKDYQIKDYVPIRQKVDEAAAAEPQQQQQQDETVIEEARAIKEVEPEEEVKAEAAPVQQKMDDSHHLAIPFGDAPEPNYFEEHLALKKPQQDNVVPVAEAEKSEKIETQIILEHNGQPHELIDEVVLQQDDDTEQQEEEQEQEEKLVPQAVKQATGTVKAEEEQEEEKVAPRRALALARRMGQDKKGANADVMMRMIRKKK